MGILILFLAEITQSQFVEKNYQDLHKRPKLLLHPIFGIYREMDTQNQ